MNITFYELELIWKIYVIIVSFVIGSIIGSFLNCLAHRICHNESIIKGRSHCDVCGHELSILELIPIFSYLINKGRCKYCKSRLNIRYLLSEIIGGLVFAITVFRFGFTLKTLEYLILCSCLLGASFADLEKMIIPNSFIIVGIINRISFILIGPNIELNLLNSLIPALIIGVIMLLLVLVMNKILKKESMGYGDVKLIFMLSLYGSLTLDIVAILLSSIIGIIYGLAHAHIKKGKLFPFGPSISLGFIVVLMIGEKVINSALILL